MAGDFTDYRAIWSRVLEEPQVFESQEAAIEAAHALARQSLGAVVHVLKLESIGTISYDDRPKLTGSLDPLRPVAGFLNPLRSGKP